MLRRLICSAAVALLTFTACSGGAIPAPPTATPGSSPAASPAALQTPLSTPVAETVTTSVVDTAGPDEFLAKIPVGWIVITARDIANKASFNDWMAAHPEVPPDVAASVAEDMTTAGNVSLFALDADTAVGGFTPSLNVAWVDAPVRDFTAWLANQAATTAKSHGLASPLQYQAWAPEGKGTAGGFIGGYRYSTNGAADNGTPLAGSQMIVPMPDGRAAVLTFTCRAEQADYFARIIDALFKSLSAGT